jgi:hypothetical protein
MTLESFFRSTWVRWALISTPVAATSGYRNKAKNGLTFVARLTQTDTSSVRETFPPVAGIR